MGHSVTAVEPTPEFRMTGGRLSGSDNIGWLDDALPDLETLGVQEGRFDFILASGVWHHLDAEEQRRAMVRIAGLLDAEGVFALSLRNGPPGAGTHVFPTDGKQTVEDAENAGLSVLLCLENQPSLMKNKEQVTWTKLVFQKKI